MNNIYARHPDATEAEFDDFLFSIQAEIDKLEKIRGENPIGLFSDRRVVERLKTSAEVLQLRSKGLIIFISEKTEVQNA